MKITGQTPFYVEETALQPAAVQAGVGQQQQQQQQGEKSEEQPPQAQQPDVGAAAAKQEKEEANKGRQEIYARITTFDGTLRYPRDDVSPAAKEFVAALVSPDPRARPSLDEALAHPWLAAATAAAAAAAAAGGRGAERRKS